MTTPDLSLLSPGLRADIAAASISLGGLTFAEARTAAVARFGLEVVEDAEREAGDDPTAQAMQAAWWMVGAITERRLQGH